LIEIYSKFDLNTNVSFFSLIRISTKIPCVDSKKISMSAPKSQVTISFASERGKKKGKKRKKKEKNRKKNPT
jgi:hypothetical protein